MFQFCQPLSRWPSSRGPSGKFRFVYRSLLLLVTLLLGLWLGWQERSLRTRTIHVIKLVLASNPYHLWLGSALPWLSSMPILIIAAFFELPRQRKLIFFLHGWRAETSYRTEVGDEYETMIIPIVCSFRFLFFFWPPSDHWPNFSIWQPHRLQFFDLCRKTRTDVISILLIFVHVSVLCSSMISDSSHAATINKMTESQNCIQYKIRWDYCSIARQGQQHFTYKPLIERPFATEPEMLVGLRGSDITSMSESPPDFVQNWYRKVWDESKRYQQLHQSSGCSFAPCWNILLEKNNMHREQLKYFVTVAVR